MQQKIRDIEAYDEPGHDQLPSVEEAKINLDVSQNFKRQSSIKYTVCVTLSVILVLLLLVTVVLVSPSLQDDVSAVPDFSNSGIPSSSSAGPDSETPSNITAGEHRFTEIVKVLKAVSDVIDLETQGSPQNLAATWIAKQDAWKVSTSNPGKLIQRYIVSLLHFALGNEQWENTLRFLSDRDECTWNTAEPSAIVTDIQVSGASCTDKGAVKQLRFRKCHLLSILYLTAASWSGSSNV